jgi:hypothetical protein
MINIVILNMMIKIIQSSCNNDDDGGDNESDNDSDNDNDSDDGSTPDDIFVEFRNEYSS